MLAFLRAVLPAHGSYVVCTTVPKTGEPGSWFKNYSCDTIEDMVELAEQLDKHQNRTVYYGLANYRDNIDEDDRVRRTVEHAFQFKTLAFDVDPKGRDGSIVYPDTLSMSRAVIAATTAIGIPDPVFVSSGSGLHGYYPLTQEISRDHWRLVSNQLRNALVAQGLTFDTTKICDPAMVLRPVGTHNKKHTPPVPVQLLGTMRWFDLAPIADKLKDAPAAPGSKVSVHSHTGAKRTSAVAQAILATEFPPADSTLIEARCPQLTTVRASHGQVDEPVWYGALGVACHTVDPLVTAIRWSDGHSGYTEAATVAKMEQWQRSTSGPALCSYFEGVNPKGCHGCTHKGKISTPVQLGLVITQEAVVVPPGEPELHMPTGYIYGDGKIWIQAGEETVPVSEYLLYPSKRFRDPEAEKVVCVLQVKLPLVGWISRELPMDILSAGVRELGTWFSNNDIYVHNEGFLRGTKRYIMTYLQDLQKDIESEAMANSFGWVDEECTGFVLGERLITKDAVEAIRMGPMAASISPHLVPKGDLAKWAAATALFSAPGLEFHALVFLMQTGSPLMKGSGLKSVLVNMYSPQSGTGKSTTGAFANSVYGDPRKLQLTVEDTQNATFKTMGVYGNLPVYIDEITTIEQKRLSHTVFFITQGREKKRMNKDGGFQPAAEWENISSSSSNSDMYALLGERMSMDGEAMRVLQFPFAPNDTFNHNGGENIGFKISRFLSNNHGVAGETLIRGILAAGGPFVVYEEALASFRAKFNFDFTGKERFWQAAMVIAYATGTLGQRLGLFNFDVDGAIRKGLEYILTLRDDIKAAEMDCFDTLGVYMAQFSSKIAVHMTNTSVSRIGRVLMPYPLEAVARVEITRTNQVLYVSGRLFINQVHFSKWCHDTGTDQKNFFAQLVQYGVTFHKDRRMNLLRGTDKTIPACRVFEIVMSHRRFVDVLLQNDIGDPTPDLKVVGGTAA